MNVNIPNFNWLKVPGDAKKKKQFSKAEKRISKICDDIVNSKRKQCGYNPLGIAGAKIQRFYEKKVYYAWQKLMVVDHEKCTNCNICSKLCPTDNIRIENKQLIKNNNFYNNCIFCLRCYNLCPQNAFLIGEKTKSLKRYKRYKRYKGAFSNTANILLKDKMSI